MRREDDEFASRDLELVYIAKKLREAERLEAIFQDASFEYLVETDTYSGGVIFRTQRVGAFFYVEPATAATARALLEQHGFKPHQPTGEMT
jgi:hypothetical protein